VKINMISLANSPAILASTIRWPRNYFNEWDYQRFGYYGLPTGQYQWWVGGAYGTNGTFSVTWPASQSQPSLVYPRGDVLTIARNSMKWSMDYYATQYHLQVVRNTGQVMVDRYYPAPYRNGSGVYQAVMPAYASEWGSGIYYWRVAGWNPTSESEWSDYQTFQIDLSSKNSRWISGDIYYFGKVPTTNVIVEAFENSAFSGDPASRIVLSFSASGGGDLGSYVLQGLQQKIYYVRAYIGLNTAGDETIQVAPHYWSSQGFVKDTVNAYKPGLVDLTSDIFASQKSVVIRDRDSDNDTLPDAWEINYFGNMDQTGDMDYDGDGQSNLQEYINDGLNLNPSAWDSDHDGLSDSFEMAYNGSAFGFRSRGASGQVLNPTVWDTDGDGYSDGAEIFRYHTDPLDPNRFPRYRPLCFGSSPSVADYDGDGRSDLSLFDTAIGNWHLYTMAGQSGVIRYGSSAMQPLVGDFDGDGRCELSLYYPFSGGWYSLNPWTGQSTASSFGDATMIPVPADYDGDRVADTAVYCPSSGYWFINASKGGIFSLPFGGPSLIPVPGDYSGDGACDLGVYDPATGTLALYLWNIYTRQGQLVRAHLGGPTMTPLACDMDGDGRADIIFFDNATGVWYVYTWTGQQISGQFGWSGCVPVPGDYDGDGRADAAIYYPPTGMWYVYTWVGQFYQGRFGGPDLAPALKGR